tara:strand:- start:273 stop:533 length:261 start_codon:yes stop_codon:yes gene_type:complete
MINKKLGFFSPRPDQSAKQIQVVRNQAFFLKFIIKFDQIFLRDGPVLRGCSKGSSSHPFDASLLTEPHFPGVSFSISTFFKPVTLE